MWNPTNTPRVPAFIDAADFVIHVDMIYIVVEPRIFCDQFWDFKTLKLDL